ncbi:MAG: ATP synthase F1 subunit delta [Bdellovibrionota bacterium]
MATVASVYAKAVFELAQEKGQLDAVYKELKSFWDVCHASQPLRAVVAGAGINPNDRKAILKDVNKALGLGQISSRLLEMLAARNRVSVVPELIKALEKMIEMGEGIQSGEVRSAVELSPQEVETLGAAIAKRVGGKVRLNQVVDPSLLGGVVATVAGKTFDASLRTQIERFKNELV